MPLESGARLWESVVAALGPDGHGPRGAEQQAAGDAGEPGRRVDEAGLHFLKMSGGVMLNITPPDIAKSLYFLHKAALESGTEMSRGGVSDTPPPDVAKSLYFLPKAALESGTEMPGVGVSDTPTPDVAKSLYFLHLEHVRGCYI